VVGSTQRVRVVSVTIISVMAGSGRSGNRGKGEIVGGQGGVSGEDTDLQDIYKRLHKRERRRTDNTEESPSYTCVEPNIPFLVVQPSKRRKQPNAKTAPRLIP
jgi:hypothetical protein